MSQPQVLPVGQLKDRWKIRRYRIATLITLHVLIVTHLVVHSMGWTSQGHSDTLDFIIFLETGAVRIGAVLLMLWLLSIPIFGRVMCGWFCHMGAWQDFGEWLMSKTPVYKSKVIHAKYLRWILPGLVTAAFIVPVVMKWYLFGVMPLGVYPEIASERKVWEVGIAEGFFMLFIFMFFSVGMFGSRAICRFACPFAVVFRPLQKLAVWRIRKKGECVECGDCSSSCMTGIDVMKEIQTHGSVQNSDCVMCFTCVQSCEHDAIGYSWKTTSPTVENAKAYKHPFLSGRVELFLLPFALFGAVLFGIGAAEKGPIGNGLVAGIPLFISVGAAILYILGKWYKADETGQASAVRQDGKE